MENQTNEKTFAYTEKRPLNAVGFVLLAIGLFYYAFNYPYPLVYNGYGLYPPFSNYLLMAVAIIIFILATYKLFVFYHLNKSKKNIVFFDDLLEFKKVIFFKFKTVHIQYTDIIKVEAKEGDEDYNLKITSIDGQKLSFNGDRFNYISEYRDFKKQLREKVMQFPGVQVNY
jgi:hypothetical protein